MSAQQEQLTVHSGKAWTCAREDQTGSEEKSDKGELLWQHVPNGL